jgi:two-component system, chemotaxis family, protein-glutamate methylesterase/glutaminase
VTPSLAHREIDAIVIGASAGGVEALSEILPALRGDARVSVFVVLHQPRERSSLLIDIFRPKCALAVREPDDKETVQRGRIYFAPADYHLMIEAGPSMALSMDSLVNYSRPSIDILFETAAEVYGRRLLAIVLSGGNEDGAQGAAVVNEAGGVVVVQDPETARVSAMPKFARDRVDVDLVLSLPQIAELLSTLK